MLARESDEIVGCGPMSRRYIASTVPASLVLISGWLGGVNCFCSRVSADIGRAGSLRGRPRLRPLVRRRSKGCDEEPGNKGQQPPHGPYGAVLVPRRGRRSLGRPALLTTRSI